MPERKADLPVLFLPIQAIGKSNEHIEDPGTLTFSMETITRWTEIGDSVARTGCRKLIFMNSHGGNVAVLSAVALDLRVRHDMLAVQAGYPEGLFSAHEGAMAFTAATPRRRSCSHSGPRRCAGAKRAIS